MRYIIGIDLGTTNNSVAYVDTQQPNLAIHSFRIPQLTNAGYVESLASLPSFCYLSAPNEFPEGNLALPWNTATSSPSSSSSIIGSFAQKHGARVPTRLVQSAKSWLCHAAANRREKILPFEGTSDNTIDKISPVEATTNYLRHIRDAWNHSIAKNDPEAEFEQQEIILTVPASFDEVARQLTVEAAKAAGFLNMMLLEEPQAAFYSWISYHEKTYASILSEGEYVLVCDVGGGTTDFSLIEVTSSGGKIVFQRMAVGDHLLLGGDNMDAAIAHHFEQKLPECTTTQRLQLRHQARSAKEALLDENSGLAFKVLLQGSGSSVIQNSFSTEITKEEMRKLLVEGFFGRYSMENALQLQKSSGFKTIGLPFEREPSITKHLAHFLKQSELVKPDYVLFNGGSMKPDLFQQEILESLKTWFPEKTPKVLDSFSLDLAVARGAAYYGKVRRNLGVKIGGGASRGYYLALDAKDSSGNIARKALTLLPRGVDEGATYEPEQTFWVTPNTPVVFQLFTSHVRLHDVRGSLVEIDEQELNALPQVQTVLKFGKKQAHEVTQEKIPVHVYVTLTAIGTIEIWLKSQQTEHKWALEFQLKNSAGQENSLLSAQNKRKDETFDSAYLEKSQEMIQEAFSESALIKPEKLMEHLEKILETPRREWPPGVLRGLWDTLIKQSPKRKIQADNEARWWNLIGFLLRPGFGYPLDDFRVKALWKVILEDAKSHLSTECQVQKWICYRRIAGGLIKGQQLQLCSEVMPILKSGQVVVKNKTELYHYSEKVRAFAGLELIEIPVKIKIGNAILLRILDETASKADYWALGRIGARHLAYGSIAQVVPVEVCTQWIVSLLAAKHVQREELLFLLSQLARKTDQRELNVPQAVVNQVHEKFPELDAVMSRAMELSVEEQERVFGEGLPVGLLLVHE